MTVSRHNTRFFVFFISALFICKLCFLPNAHAEVVEYINVNGYSLNSSGGLEQFTRFVVNDDKIAAIDSASSKAEPSQAVPSQVEHSKIDRSVDLQGQTVLPGLIDAHGHILRLGENLLKVDLRASTSEQEAVNRVRQFIANKKTDSNAQTHWIVGDGWNQELWSNKQFPSKVSLDKAFPNTPVVLSRIDGHAVWVNSAALSIAGIDAQTLSPSGGEIVKDKNGMPNGLLIDNAEDLIRKVIPKPSLEELSQYLELASEHLLSLGVTSAHDAGVNMVERDLYINRAKQAKLRFRVYAMLSATDPNIIDMLKQGHYVDKQHFLSIRSVKAYGDGALGSRGAALLAPYSDDPTNKGLLVTPEERLPAVFNTVIGANFQLNFHAIGDRANRLALQHFAKSFAELKVNIQRHRIEHAQVVAVEDIPLFKKYGIIASMQPTHATSDMNMAEDRVGKARLKGAYAWQSFLQQGTPVALGSDFPVELANPFHGLHAAVTRQNDKQEPAEGWLAHESLDRVQALKGFTLDAAYSAFQEGIIGSLEVGKKADFIVIDRDYFKVKAADIRDTQVLQTYVNGKLAYSHSH